MIIGIGVDIADNTRFEKLSKTVLEKLFTPFELSELDKHALKGEYLASRFASKEAFVKALGSGFRGIYPRDIEIREDDNGKPYINLLKDMEKDYKIHLSLSHERNMSVAMVVIEDGTL